MTASFHFRSRLVTGLAGLSRLGRVLALLASLLAAGALGGAVSAPSSSAATTPRINLRVLLLGSSTTEPDFQAWEAALQREGVPFDTIVGPSHTPITASTLSSTASDGTPVANYEAIIVSVGDVIDCSTGTCVSDLAASEWTAIEQYEAQFGIRQITGYIYPGASYGLNTPTVAGSLDGTDPTTSPQVSGTLTTDGQTVFPYLNATAPITMDTGTYGYEATPVSPAAAGTSFDTLVSGPNGSALVGIYTDATGVQQLVETYDQNQAQVQAELLRHGALEWVTRGVYLGDQRNYLETHIDDTFLADASWSISGNATTAPHTTDFNDADSLREVPADVVKAADWSKANNFRIDMLFNGGGSTAVAVGDTLVGAGDSGSGTTGSSGSAGGTRAARAPVPAQIRCSRSSRHQIPRARRIRATSGGSATRGITRTSTGAARPRTTSRPSSTRTPRGRRRRQGRRRAIRSTAASG